MNTTKTFLQNCPNWQLRLILAAASLVLVVIAGLIYAPAASFLIFLGAYIVTTGPDWREALKGGFSLMPMPNMAQVRAAVETSAASPKRITNTRRKELARKERERNKRRK